MKIHNFCAGPSILPSEVFDEASNAVKDLNGSGLSLLEISHRSHAFVEIMDEARDLSLELLGLSGNDYTCLLYTSPSPRDTSSSRMPSSA